MEMLVRVHGRIVWQRYSNLVPWLQTCGNDASESFLHAKLIPLLIQQTLSGKGTLDLDMATS